MYVARSSALFRDSGAVERDLIVEVGTSQLGSTIATNYKGMDNPFIND